MSASFQQLTKDEDGTPSGFHNHSGLDFPKLKGDPDNIGRHLAEFGFGEVVELITAARQRAVEAIPR